MPDLPCCVTRLARQLRVAAQIVTDAHEGLSRPLREIVPAADPFRESTEERQSGRISFARLLSLCESPVERVEFGEVAVRLDAEEPALVRRVNDINAPLFSE